MADEQELFDPAPPETPESAETPPVEQPAAKPTPPKDPETGRFVKVKPDHPPSIVADAKTIGYSDEAIAGMTTASLYEAVRTYLQQQVSFRDQQSRARTMEDNSQKPPETDDLDLEGAEDFDPRLTKTQQAAARRLRAQQARIDALEKRLEQTDRVSSTERVDAAFESLGDKYSRFVGKGSVVDLEKDSKEFRRRNAILQQAGIDLKNLPPQAILKKLIQQTADVFFEPAEEKEEESPYQGVEGKKPRATKEDWDQAGLRRPTQRGGANEPKGEALAVQRLTAKMREQEANGAKEKEIMDGLLE